MALTVEMTSIPGGCAFRRSDGESFFLLKIGNTGNAVLHHGLYAGIRPSIELVELHCSVADKIAAARNWILAYPDWPGARMFPTELDASRL